MTLLAIRLAAIVLAVALATIAQANAQCAAMLAPFLNWPMQMPGGTVYATVSKHYAAQNKAGNPDPVFFEFGQVVPVGTPPTSLSGNGLAIRSSTSNFAVNMSHTSSLIVTTAGAVTYNEYINGNPVGGMPAVTFQGVCGGGQVTGMLGNTSWAIGFSTAPPGTIPK